MKERLPNCAGVYILDVPYQADRLYSYLIPEKLRETLAPGDFVSLPFGKGNRQQTALVFEMHLSGGCVGAEGADRPTGRRAICI